MFIKVLKVYLLELVIAIRIKGILIILLEHPYIWIDAWLFLLSWGVWFLDAHVLRVCLL